MIAFLSERVDSHSVSVLKDVKCQRPCIGLEPEPAWQFSMLCLVQATMSSINYVINGF